LLAAVCAAGGMGMRAAGGIMHGMLAAQLQAAPWVEYVPQICAHGMHPFLPAHKLGDSYLTKHV